MLKIHDIKQNQELEYVELANILGGLSVLDANLKTRYVTYQRKASKINRLASTNLLARYVYQFGLLN